MKTLAVLTALVAALVVAATAAAAEDPKLPYGQVLPGPTNPWGGKKAKVAFFVETLTSGKGESVWGRSAGRSCIRTNLFPRKERVVFHIMAWDAKAGKTIEPEDVRYAYIKIPGLPNQKLSYGPHGKDPKTAPWTWYFAWDIAPDYPFGAVPYELVFKTKGMAKGEVATFKELPIAPEQLTVVESRPQL